MDEGKTPAPWFLEVNGRKQGPYTSQEIMKLLMDGVLKVESKIFDSAVGAWKIAADVIPYLELGSAPAPGHRHKQTRDWQPPPRPVEFKDVHITLSRKEKEKENEVDYFVLIDNQRKTFDRGGSATQSRESSSRPPLSEKSRRAPRQSILARLSEPRRKKTAKIVHVADPNGAVEGAQVSDTALSNGHDFESNTAILRPGTDGILVAEVESSVPFGLGSLIVMGRRARYFINSHKSMMSIAAGLCLVFAGTYGTVRFMSERKGREPATVVAGDRSSANTTSAEARQKPIAISTAMATDDALGTGRNKVVRPLAGVSRPLSPVSGNALTTSSPETSNDSKDAHREPPQYFSTADSPPTVEPSLPLANDSRPHDQRVTETNLNSAAAAQNAVDPNSGIVQPPGYIPPPDVPSDINSPAPLPVQASESTIVTQ